MPLLARRFFCAALVAEADERRDVAFSQLLSAAWACDDSGVEEQARICRDRAVEMLAAAMEGGDVPASNPVGHVVLADVLRRAGRFEEAMAACAVAESGLLSEDGEESRTAAVIAFIRALAEAADDDVHVVAEAFAGER